MAIRREVVLVWVALTRRHCVGRGAVRCALAASIDFHGICPVQRGGHHYHHGGAVHAGLGVGRVLSAHRP